MLELMPPFYFITFAKVSVSVSKKFGLKKVLVSVSKTFGLKKVSVSSVSNEISGLVTQCWPGGICLHAGRSRATGSDSLSELRASEIIPILIPRKDRAQISVFMFVSSFQLPIP